MLHVYLSLNGLERAEKTGLKMPQFQTKFFLPESAGAERPDHADRLEKSGIFPLGKCRKISKSHCNTKHILPYKCRDRLPGWSADPAQYHVGRALLVRNVTSVEWRTTSGRPYRTGLCHHQCRERPPGRSALSGLINCSSAGNS